jgi:hypothetical protein
MGRSRVWACPDRQIRDRWMADGATSLGVLANAWKETVRDAVADTRAHREAAKTEVRRMIGRRLVPEAERKRLCRAGRGPVSGRERFCGAAG